MLRLHLLGVPAVTDGGRPLAGAAAQPRRLAVLALLARAGARGLTRDKLIGTLWSETDEEKARRALTHALYALRRDLGAEDAVEGADTLRLGTGQITSDAAEFDGARAEGRFADAAALYDGPFMDGFHLPDAGEFERWVDGERAELAGNYAEVLETLAGNASSSGKPHEAVVWWRKRAAEDPLNARLTIALMDALDRSGDRAGALRQARIHEAIVEQELALPPDREVVALANRLREERIPETGDRVPETGDRVPDTGYRGTGAPTPTHDSRRTTHEPPRPSHDARPIRRWIAVAAVLVLAILAWWRLKPVSPATPRVAVGHVADYRGSGPALAGPITDLLATNLARIPGVEIVSTARLYELLHEAGGEDSSAAGLAAAARRAGASQLIEGALYALPDGRLRLDLRRTDLGTGAVLGAQRVEAGDVFALVDSGTARLAGDVGRRAPGGSVADITTRSEAAARFYVEGIRRYHQGDHASAAGLFDSALVADSLFAMAAYYGFLSATDPADAVARLHHTVRLAGHASERERWLILATASAANRDPRLVNYAESLATRYPSEIEGHLFLGMARLVRGEFMAAVAPLRQSIAMAANASPDDRCPDCEAWGALVSAYHASDSLAAARRVADEWTGRRPRSPQAWGALGEVQEALGDSGALDAYRRAGAIDPAYANPVLMLAIHRIWRGDYTGAERTLRELIESTTPSGRTDGLWMLGLTLRQQGRLREALETTVRLRAASTVPAGPRGSTPTIVAQEAQILFEMGDARRAAALFDSVARWSLPLADSLGRERARAWWLTHAAEALVAAGDTTRAAAMIDTIRVLGESSQNGRDRRLFHHVRGLLLRARGDRDGAITEFRAAIYSPTIGYTRVNAELARTLLSLGRPREAVAILQPALRGGLEGSNLYVTRTELHALLSDAWYAAGVGDSARAHWRAVADAWAGGDPPFDARAAAARARTHAAR